jgi:hypothetical protein
MNDSQPAELIQLQEKVAEIFWFVKKQARLAESNLDGQKESLSGDLDNTERGVHKRIMELGQMLLGEYFRELGSGDLGYRVTDNGYEYERKHRERAESILSVFGHVPYKQSLYYCGEGSSVRPLAVMANLPERQSTYFAQALMSRLGIQDTYRESQEFYAEFLGHSLSPRTIETVIEDQAESYCHYDTQRVLPDAEEEKSIGVVSFDGKGIPVVKSEQTTGKTREALVGCVYTADPERRDAGKIAKSLVMPELLSDEDKKSKEQKNAEGIEYYGSVTEPKKKVFSDVKERASARFAAASIATVVCVMDGAPCLWKLAKKYFPKAIYILDVIHVLGYLKLATTALEKDKKAARILTCAYLTVILQGNVRSVIAGMRIRLTKNRIRGRRRKDVEKAITYFQNHEEYMRYDEYLVAGYPIATGVVESACGHLIKDRMGKAGAKWVLTGAESVLKLRCIKASGHWHDFQKIRQRRERHRLYSKVLANAA